ncbi:hypothetical protein [Sphingomonas sp. 3-13AW]|uniref:hypothetical protein n=1 Tax=Sphingomonas sp. 3-13AW TaxID=3050450 RepID=UPI003BB4F688
MKTAVVRASDLLREGRWDAGFHIARSELAEAMDSLRGRYSEQQAIDLVDSIPLSEKASLTILRTGSGARGMGAAEAQEVTRRYPFLSLALVASEADASMRRIRSEIERNQKALAVLFELSDEVQGD